MLIGCCILTVNVVVLDEDERGVVVVDYRRRLTFLLHVDKHRDELVDHGHVNVATVVPGNDNLNLFIPNKMWLIFALLFVSTFT